MFFEKAAVEIGGGSNHRYNLSTAVMLKDNHIDAAGGVTRVIEMARAHASFTTTVEIEQGEPGHGARGRGGRRRHHHARQHDP